MLSVLLKGRNRRPLSTTEIEAEDVNALDVAVVNRHESMFAQPRFKRSDNGSTEMALNGLAVGTQLVIWNGTGVGDTGGDWTRAGVGTESVTAMKSGTNGLDTGVAAKNDIVEFTTTSLSLAAYSVITFWLQPKAFPGSSKLEIEWRDAGGKVGNKLRVDDYVAMTIDAWQQVSIPLVDFALTGNVETLRLKMGGAAGQHHWVDDFILAQPGGGGPFIYRLQEDDRSKLLEPESLSIMLAAGSTGWLVGDFATIDGGLAGGLLIRYWDYFSGEFFWSFSSLTNKDLFQRFKVENNIAFLDSDRMLRLDLSFLDARPRVEQTKVIDIVVQDDLLTLTSLQAVVTGGRR